MKKDLPAAILLSHCADIAPPTYESRVAPPTYESRVAQPQLINVSWDSASSHQEPAVSLDDHEGLCKILVQILVKDSCRRFRSKILVQDSTRRLQMRAWSEKGSPAVLPVAETS
jgi:hypothetical protein